MEQFNKALSFILGLVVVAVFIIVASGKFSFPGIGGSKTKSATAQDLPQPTSKPWFSFSKPAATPAIKPATTPTPTYKTITDTKGGAQEQGEINTNYNSYSGSQTPSSIPNTGLPLILYPLFGGSLLTGVFIKKAGKKD